ncbi:MAG: PQQ-dependent sugar dehydrogenase [Geobacteraceae bacterium]|nr:PQQ-dependent sugar dehydrogenase [Geobacteraceae bacterium]
MRGVIEFLLYMLLLWGAALLLFGVKTFSFDSPLLLFVLMLGVGFALALIGKRWGRGMLLLAIPMAVLLAHFTAERLWPPPEEGNRARVYRLTPELNADPATLPSEHNSSLGSDNDRREAPDFGVQSRNLSLECADGRASTGEITLLTGMDIHPIVCGLKGIEDIVFPAEADPEVMYASLPDSGMVYRVERENPSSASSAADKPRSDMWRKNIFYSGLDRPMGLEWYAGSLYVATRTEVLKLTNPASATGQEVTAETVVSDLPPAIATEHRSLAIDADGTIYLSMGAGDAEPQELNWQRAAVLRITPAGEVELFAAGLHHARALVLHPQTGALWALEDSPETLDLDSPPDEINVIKQGGDYGWPFCYGFRVPDKDLGTKTICTTTDAPVAFLPPHSSPAGLAFGANLDAPARYQSMLYVALKGRVYDAQGRGFRIVGLPLDEQGDLTGWGVDVVSSGATPTKLYAQPTALAVAPDRNLYLADAYSGMVYRFMFPFDVDLKPASAKEDNSAAEHKNGKE